MAGGPLLRWIGAAARRTLFAEASAAAARGLHFAAASSARGLLCAEASADCLSARVAETSAAADRIIVVCIASAAPAHVVARQAAATAAAAPVIITRPVGGIIVATGARPSAAVCGNVVASGGGTFHWVRRAIQAALLDATYYDLGGVGCVGASKAGTCAVVAGAAPVFICCPAVLHHRPCPIVVGRCASRSPGADGPAPSAAAQCAEA